MGTQNKLIITKTQPTSIVKDFMTFSEYLENHEIQLTKTQGWLTRKDLLAINALMTEPEQEVTTYSDQNAYPLLTLFFHLSLAAKLFRTEPYRNGKQTLHPTELLTIFNSLNPTEMYVSLLETLWIDADWDHILGSASSYGPSSAVRMVFEHLEQVPPGNTIKVNSDSNDGRLSGLLWRWGYFVHYFRYFGFWETTKDEERSAMFGSKFHYEIKTITLTPLFYLLCKELVRSRDLEYWNLALRRESGDWRGVPGGPLPADEETDEWETESFAQSLIPLFTSEELTKWLPRQSGLFFSGTYDLKVAVRQNCWRRIRISSHFTLYHLHEAIQHAFGFGDDHLYAFFLDGKRWSQKRVFYSLDADDTPVVTEARLGELDLSVGQTFLYLFDFGDEWEFAVTVEDVQQIDTRKAKPQVTESKGNSPKQYNY